MSWKNEELFNRALTIFGVENRLNKFREECCEAAVMVDRLMNNRPDALIDLIDEMADVEITLYHARKIINEEYFCGKDVVREAIDRKMKKFESQVIRAEKKGMSPSEEKKVLEYDP